MDWRENKRLAEVATTVTGTKHCRSCDQQRRADTGKWRVGANGRRIWRCAACASKSNPAGFK